MFVWIGLKIQDPQKMLRADNSGNGKTESDTCAHSDLAVIWEAFDEISRHELSY